MLVTSRRIYSDKRQGKEYRVLADRLWPRGVSKEDADVDMWAKDLAPSDDLRKWFHDDRDSRYEEFAEKYRHELEDLAPDLDELRNRSEIVLLTAAKDVDHSHIPTLTDYLTDVLNDK